MDLMLDTSNFYQEPRPNKVYERYFIQEVKEVNMLDTTREIPQKVLTLSKNTEKTKTNYKIIDLKISKQVLNSIVNLESNKKWVLNTGATHHIVCNKSYFNSFQNSNKRIFQGNAKTINIVSFSNVII